jgi:hypothetical protein
MFLLVDGFRGILDLSLASYDILFWPNCKGAPVESAGFSGVMAMVGNGVWNGFNRMDEPMLQFLQV